MPYLYIYWIKSDLRALDNEILDEIAKNEGFILPVYCVDPRQFEKTSFGFPKTGIFRTKFLLESLKDLKLQFQDFGADLVVRKGKPEEIIFALARQFKVAGVYCQEEATSEETDVENALNLNLKTIGLELEYFWGNTLYNYDDLPLENISELPDIFTQFRKLVEKKSDIRPTFSLPEKLKIPEDISVGEIPKLSDFGFDEKEIEKCGRQCKFIGGSTFALQRLKAYFWENDCLKNYKETRNDLLGMDYSSKFSPWLALGCISPRTIFEEVEKYEKNRIKNSSTYWMIFELIWRDYFRFVAMKFGNKIFHSGGIKNEKNYGSQNIELFWKWANGETGIPFIDANMIELKETGFMSNRGRQNVASFLVKDLKLDWRMGAEWFESMLVDYDPCSNYGNWNYVAGIGNDPRENRYFNVLSQASRYDSKGGFVKYWLPQLEKIPSKMIHEPYLLTEAEQKFLKIEIGKDYPKPCFNIYKWQARKKYK